MTANVEPKGCLMALLDFSFTEFITTKIIKWLYIILLVVVAIAAAVGVITGLITMFTNSFLAGLGMIIGTAIGAIIYAMLARVWMELIIVLFRIAENTTELVRQGHLRPQA